MTARVFIDGEVGTTGLQIRARLADRDDVDVISLPEAERKSPRRRADLLNAVDLAILCLPDNAAREAVAMIENPDVRVLDASTAHRVAPGWIYGLPEYDRHQADKIAAATRVANPGCYALSSVAMLYPLIKAGILPAGHFVAINAISGYSGGGRQLIEAYEDRDSDSYTEAPFSLYALGLDHKHIPEIQRYGGLANRPLFMPSVGRFRDGMIVQLPLQLRALPGAPSPADVHDALARHYEGRTYVTVAAPGDVAAMERLEPRALNGTNELRLHVFGNPAHGQAVVVALLDNLGKGASGQAVQNMNLMLGFEESRGLARHQP